MRILDLGAGPGPASFAVADALIRSGHRVDALLLDGSEAALAEARALAQGRPRLTLRTQRADLSRPPALGGEAFSLISAAHLLSELPGGAEEKSALLRVVCDTALASDGALLVLEPALRETGRTLLEVRDRLLGAQTPLEPRPAPLRALAPCLTQAACPALANPRDWCTAEVAWEAPPHLLQLSRELGLHAEAPLSFAPLLLARAAPPPPADLWRVVGVPPAEKGKKRLFVCAGPGRRPAVRLDRDAAPLNAAFDAATRGDLLRLQALAEKGDGLRLSAQSPAALLDGPG